MAEQILLSRTVRGGTVGGNLNLTTFRTEPRAGMVAEVVEEGGGGMGRLTGQPRSGGEAAWMGSSEKAGFNQSTDTTSVLDPIWRRKNLLFLSRTRYGPRYKGAKEGMDASSRTKTNSAVNKAGGSC